MNGTESERASDPELRRRALAAEEQARRAQKQVARLEASLATLTASESRYRHLVERSADIITRHRPDGSVEYQSAAAATILGFDAEQVAAGAMDELMPHPEDLPNLIEAIARANEGETSILTFRAPHTDGTYRDLEMHMQPFMDDDGHLMQIVSTTRDVTERKARDEELERAHREISQREALLAEAQKLAGVGSWSYDPHTREVTWSEEMYRLFDVEIGSIELNETTYTDRCHPDDGYAVFQAMEEQVNRSGTFSITHRVLLRDGGIRWIDGRGAAVYDEVGGLRLMRGTALDITVSRANEAALHDSEQRSRLTFENAPTAAMLVSTGGALLRVNRAACRLLRRSERALLTARLDELASAEDRAAVQDDLFRTAEVGGVQKTERRYRRPNGQVIHTLLSTSLVRTPSGEADYLVCQLEDVTERKQAERERDEHAGMLRAVIDNDHSQIYVKDLEGRYLLVNNSFLRAFGFTEVDVLGRTDFDLYPPETAERWSANDRLALEGTHTFEEYSDRPDGRHVYESVKVPLQYGDGEIYAICGISLDVTERRRAAEALVSARDAALAATAAKSAFLATMSHEIRTPMNAVIGMTGLLLDTALDATQRDFVETVRSSGDQLLAVINDILDFSKIEAGDLELEVRAFELRECVEGAVALFAGVSHGLDLVSHIEDDVPDVVIGDVTRLRQVIANLVGNAIKFTSDGDVLVVVSRSQEPPGSAPELPGDQVRVRLSVTDTGIGIPADRLDRLFRSFSQVDASTTRVYGGTGLGLAISKAIVEAMGGTLSVASTEGQGSTFSFDITLQRSAELRVRPVSLPREQLAGRRVLIVDDNDTNRRILRLQLEGVGMVCADEALPVRALERVRDGESFDVAVLDMHMPVMDGEDLAERLHDLPGQESLPLMLLSSVGDRAGSERRSHFSVVMAKPSRRDPLVDAVAETYLRGHSRDRPVTSHAARAMTGAGVPAPRDGRRHGDVAEREPYPLRILLAEDNAVNQKVAQLMLAKMGHVVDTVGNGQEAVDGASRLPYDVILMDVHMPVLDGLDATRRIRADPSPHRPFIVALTASVTTEDRLACESAGMDAYLSKPVRSDHLQSLLADLGDIVALFHHTPAEEKAP